MTSSVASHIPPEALEAFDCLDAAVAVARPPEDLTPSEWNERYIHLSRVESVLPGRWSHEPFPFLAPMADEFLKALRAGKNLAIIKAGQVGVSRVVLNWANYLKAMFSGSILYMTSVVEVAKEFSRDRLDRDLDTCEPLKAKALRGRKAGELVAIKRFVDGKMVLVGGKAVSGYESVPYPFVIVDEYDSLQDELLGRGDPLANVEIRLDAAASMGARTQVIAFAHPTTIERGAGKLYYRSSDQRRAFVRCVHCGSHDHWLSWEHVQVLPEGEERQEVAERNPDRYVYVAPCCGVEISDSDRAAMVRAVEFRSTLEPEEAEKKRWVGLHISQLYSGKSLHFLAEKWIEGIDDPGKRKVFVNKRLGEVYREVTREADPEAWEACKPPSGSQLEFELGQVPSWVQFLTAGQDSRSSQLHWAIWGWGMVRDAGELLRLCGAPVAVGVVPRQPPRPTLEAADLAVFDQLLYDRRWPRLGEGGGDLWVAMGLHDSGWQPVAVYSYCLGRRDGRAFPATGAGLDEVSAARTQIVQMGVRPGFKDPVTGESYREAHEQKATLNTFVLKGELVGMVDTKFPLPDGSMMGRVVLPRNAPPEYVAQSGSEYLARNDKGKLEWRHRGPNHWADCNTQALGAALYLARDLRETADEQRERERAESARRVREHAEEDERVERGGGWWNGVRR